MAYIVMACCIVETKLSSAVASMRTTAGAATAHTEPASASSGTADHASGAGDRSSPAGDLGNRT